MKLVETLRWFGPDDGVSLADIRQAGATGVVHALHHIANGELWPVAEIQARRELIEAAGLSWAVVESVPVHEDIKTGRPGADRYVENYKQTIRNLGRCGIGTICYNFMPVLDWTRTDLDTLMEDGSSALSYDHNALVAFDLHILKRPLAEADYESSEVRAAQILFDGMDAGEKSALERNVLAGLAGSEESYSLDEFQAVLDGYAEVDDACLRRHLRIFLEQVIPIAEEAQVLMAIHPDDPARSLLGLPRIVSTEEDLEDLLDVIDSPSNGLTLCVGSLASRQENDISRIAQRFIRRVNFVHLRNVRRDQQQPKSFYESDHLDGDIDMYEVLSCLVKEDRPIPMRPDHGHKMIDDLGKDTNPGYSCIGRLRGLAEMRGLELGIRRNLLQD